MYPNIPIPGTGSTLSAHTFMVFVAMAVAGRMAYRCMVVEERLDARRCFWAMLCIAVLGLAGGRLHFVAAHPALYRNQFWLAFDLGTGKLHLPGAVLAILLGGSLVLFVLRLPVRRFADALAPAVALGITFGRLGCFLRGCCFGTRCDYPWCVVSPASIATYKTQVKWDALPEGVTGPLTEHALPLYFAAAALAIFCVLLWLRRRKKYDGQVALVLLLLFSATSAALEPFRGDYAGRTYLGPAPELLWVTGAMTLASLIALAMAERAHRRSEVTTNLRQETGDLFAPRL